MLLTGKLVAAACFLALAVRHDSASAYPSSESHKKKLVIYAPIKYKVIHHHKVEKVPIVVKKHVHRHYNQHEAKVEHHSGVKHYDHFHYTFENSEHDDHDDDHHHHDSEEAYEADDGHNYHEVSGDEEEDGHDDHEEHGDHEDGDHHSFRGFIAYNAHHSPGGFHKGKEIHDGDYKGKGHSSYSSGGSLKTVYHYDSHNDDDDDDYTGHKVYANYDHHSLDESYKTVEDQGDDDGGSLKGLSSYEGLHSGGSYKFISSGQTEESHSGFGDYAGYNDHYSSGELYKTLSGHSHSGDDHHFRFKDNLEYSSSDGSYEFDNRRHRDHKAYSSSYRGLESGGGFREYNNRGSTGVYKYINLQNHGSFNGLSKGSSSSGSGSGSQKGGYIHYQPNYDWSHSFGRGNSYGNANGYSTIRESDYGNY